MTPERWQKIEQLYHAALEREQSERAAYLQEVCAGDDALRQEVESLLGQETLGNSFLESPAIEVAAQALAKDTGQLVKGRQLGWYKIVSFLGAGGMGEVYKARDNRLDRFVAIKVLPPDLADRAELRERFEREAKTIASLNHPHICTLHDVGHQEGIDFLVMEYVEGETLANRLLKGPLPVDQALRYAVEIADALDKAHRNGVIHRDIKPGNIMLTKNGAKLLDFGLAKLKQEAAPAVMPLSQLPALSKNLTAEGTILGTLQYMAPEQVEGKIDKIDGRTDIFAFGALVYEMTTGRKAFDSKSTASLIAKILETDPPPMRSIQPMTLPALDRVVKKCFAKDPDERWQTAGDLRGELKWIAEGGSQSGVSAASAPVRKSREGLAWAVAAVLIVTTGLGLGWTITHFRKPAGEIHTVRLRVNAPVGTEFRNGSAISPDGRLLAFVAGSTGGDKLWIRSLNSLAARDLPGTDGAAMPFWSPDSRSLGFFAKGKLKRIDVAGGLPTVICDANPGRGGTWNANGTILFNSVNDGPLLRVSSNGGTPVQLTTLDSARGENSHRWPQFLPDGNQFIFFVRGTGSGGEDNVSLGSLDHSKEKTRLLISTGNAVYAPDRGKQSGHLFWVRDGVLMAQTFDASHGQLRGEPVIVAESVGFSGISGVGRGEVSISNEGTLFYGAQETRQYQLTWYGRDGKSLGILGQPGQYDDLAISPDGKRVALRATGGTTGGNVWQVEIARGIATLVTFNGRVPYGPIWSPDSQRIVYEQGSPPNLFSQNANGSGLEERLAESNDGQNPQDWSLDGKFLLYVMTSNDVASKRQPGLWLLPMADRQPVPFLTTPFSEGRGKFSPDGRWIAYTSDESGRNEIYVKAFSSGGFKGQVSNKGGDFVRWRRDGKELFYLAPDRKLMSVAVRAGSGTLEFSAPNALFTIPPSSGPAQYSYDVMPDGQRFLELAPAEETEAPSMTVVLNWQADLSDAK